MSENIYCKASDLKTESDVENKFIINLLSNKTPLGFNYSTSEYRTKPNIKALLIDKGSSGKLYYPDYVIIFNGLPLLVIEAKAPNEDIEEGLRQARLYANELNSKFSRSINPCQRLIATDGLRTICSYVDSSEIFIDLKFDEIDPTNPSFNKLLEFGSKEVLNKEAEIILKTIRGGSKFIKPKQLLGGKSVQNTELKENSFGSTLSLEFRSIFNPASQEDRRNIVNNAYITTKRILHHVQPIEKIIRKSKTIGLDHVKTIEDTETPTEIIDKLRNRDSLRNELILLIGNVGAGKSTFTDYLKEKALPKEIKDSTAWLSINLNNAPLNKEEIYKWIKNEIINRLIENHPQYDFEEKNTLLKLYGLEFKALRKGVAQFYEPGSSDWNKLFANKLIELESNPDIKSKALIRYLCTNRQKLFVVVLDNCDKRKTEEQLLMFEVATWLKEFYECLVFLPMRDTTFNIYRKEKPLDTVVKDLVFKIDPPLLREVIIERVKYTLRVMGKDKKLLFYELPNGMKVEYPQSEQGLYLASIVRSLFENVYFNRLVSGIAGKDLRKGLEVFLDFCKSGHLDEAEVLKMKKFGAQHILKNHLVSKIILRGSKKYYAGEESIIKNVFASNPEEDVLPNPFTRLFILKWLFELHYKDGPSKIKGFHRSKDLIISLVSCGHNRERVLKELDTLLKYGLITNESLSNDLEDENDLISLTSYGIIHLDLLDDLNYMSACAEDVYFRENQIAVEICNKMTNKTGNGQFSFETIISNSLLLINYLDEYANNFILSQTSSDLSVVDYSKLY